MNAFIFPGQGAQFKGMVQDFCSENESLLQIIKEAEKISNRSVTKILWETELSELSRSDNSQLAITVVSIVIINELKNRGIESDICAGFSLGEFSALYDSGVLSFEDTIKLVTERGNIMQKVCDNLSEKSEGNLPGMMAILGLPLEQIESLIEPLSKKGIAFVANINSPKQTVVSGTYEGLEECEKIFKDSGARRVVRLKVAGPFHSPLMKDAAIEFEKVLESVNFNNPQKILLSNVTGKIITTGEEAKKLAVKHLTCPVCWTEEEKVISELFEKSEEKNSLYEVGPGTVLSGLWRDSGYGENLTCIPCGKFEQISEL